MIKNACCLVALVVFLMIALPLIRAILAGSRRIERGPGVIDVEGRPTKNVTSVDLAEARRKILDRVQTGEITAEEAEKELKELESR